MTGVQMATIRRTKDEVGTSTGSGSMSDERLSWHLANWSDWMRHSGHGPDGYPRASIGLRSVGQSHFDEMVRSSDTRCAMACNAIIEGLPPAHSAAIFRQYLHSVFIFPRDNFLISLERGKEAVRSGLESRGVW